MHRDAHLTRTSEVHHHNHHRKTKIKWSFFGDAIMGLVTFLIREIRVWRIICYMLYAIIPYFKNFLMSYKIVQKSVELISGPVTVYLLGTYLTPLPDFVVIPLSFSVFYFGLEKILLLLGCVMVYAFLNVLAI